MFKKMLIKTIQAILWCIDKDHRNKEEIAMDDTKKFTHVQETNFQSDFAPVKRIFRTVPYTCWELKTESFTTYAADRHRYVKEDGTLVWLEDLKPNDEIKTKNGIEKVISTRNLNVRTHMYDVEVDSKDHLYYADGILSHNTTCAAAYILWTAMFKPDQTILLVSNKFSAAQEIMKRIRYGYEYLPDYLRAGAIDYNKGNLTFDNGSSIIARATTEDSARGLSISLLYLDEFSFVQKSIQKEFWASVMPTLSEGGRCIITSTPNNEDDIFADIWKRANKETDEYGNKIESGIGQNGFKPFIAYWWQHPSRDEEWEKDMRGKLGDETFERECNLKFISFDETLIKHDTLTRLQQKDPIEKIGEVRWYEKPQPNHWYIVALDPSMGTGGDFAAIQVLRIPDLKQVAEWKHNKTDIKGQIKVLLQILKHIYTTLKSNSAQKGEPEIYWSVENNSLGEAAITVISETGEEYFPGFFVHEPKKGIRRRGRKGLTTTNKNKVGAATKLKSLVESEKIDLSSAALIRELKNFVATGQSYAAKSGENDDLTMSLILCIRILKIIKDWDPNIEEELKENIEEGMDIEPMPVGFL